jgi:hypothetical protein
MRKILFLLIISISRLNAQDTCTHFISILEQNNHYQYKQKQAGTSLCPFSKFYTSYRKVDTNYILFTTGDTCDLTFLDDTLLRRHNRDTAFFINADSLFIFNYGKKLLVQAGDQSFSFNYYFISPSFISRYSYMPDGYITESGIKLLKYKIARGTLSLRVNAALGYDYDSLEKMKFKIRNSENEYMLISKYTGYFICNETGCFFRLDNMKISCW